jgi:hypothetical protein
MIVVGFDYAPNFISFAVTFSFILWRFDPIPVHDLSLTGLGDNAH